MKDSELAAQRQVIQQHQVAIRRTVENLKPKDMETFAVTAELLGISDRLTAMVDGLVERMQETEKTVSKLNVGTDPRPKSATKTATKGASKAKEAEGSKAGSVN